MLMCIPFAPKHSYTTIVTAVTFPLQFPPVFPSNVQTAAEPWPFKRPLMDFSRLPVSGGNWVSDYSTQASSAILLKQWFTYASDAANITLPVDSHIQLSALFRTWLIKMVQTEVEEFLCGCHGSLFEVSAYPLGWYSYLSSWGMKMKCITTVKPNYTCSNKKRNQNI